MKLAILGPPGSGKGQNTSKIVNKYNLHHIVVGDIVKAEIRKNTDLGKLMYSYTSVGKFVPSEIVIKLLAQQLDTFSKDEGFIIDTAPINMEQYKLMKDSIQLDAVISLEINDFDILRNRTLNRLICPKCRSVSSIQDSPDSICPSCGAELERRYDDNLDTVNFRLEQYKRETVPVLNEFEKQKKLIKINAELSKDEVFEQICQKIDDFFEQKPLN